MIYSITEEVVKWLTSLGYRAMTHPPKTHPAEFVTVNRQGGGVYDLVDNATLTIQTWAKTEARADEMAYEIREEALLRSRPDGVGGMSVNAGPYPFWDDDTGQPRYQTVYEVTCHIIKD